MAGRGGYSSTVFQSKVCSFDESQQSIQALSSWILANKDHSDEMIHLWSIEYFKVPVERKLTFLYLCNEIMQTSRRYTQDFINSFTTVLPNAVKTIMSDANDNIKSKVNRLIRIWKDREVLPFDIIKEISELPFVDIGDINAPPSNPPNVVKNTTNREPTKPEQPITKLEYPKQLEEIIKLYMETSSEEVTCLLAEDALNSSAKASIFPWNPGSKNKLNTGNAFEKASDVAKTYAAAIDFKQLMEEHLEKRAKLLDLINQFKEKQEAITNSHISQLHDVLNFLGNIKAAKTDIDVSYINNNLLKFDIVINT